MSSSPVPAALAIAAHPDDIEYVMAGTLLALRKAGWAIHYFNLSTGNCGSLEMDAEATARTRLGEAQEAARRLGAEFHPPIANDLEIVYSVELLRKVAAVVRQVNPSIVLTHALSDYMEDHMETARLAVTATFARGMPNYRSIPPRKPVLEPCVVYHAMPHGRDDVEIAAPIRLREDADHLHDRHPVHDLAGHQRPRAPAFLSRRAAEEQHAREVEGDLILAGTFPQAALVGAA